MTFNANITDDIIQTGLRHSCHNCPLAIAIRRAVPEAETVDVRNDEFSFLLGGKSWEGKLPAEAQEWILRFDTPPWERTTTPLPVTFQLTAHRSVA